jgi:hypothetical protein
MRKKEAQMVPSEEQLSEAIYEAARSCFTSLFSEHPETYYYCTLTTTGEAHPPTVSAWSYEALNKADPEEKWSYADSPYCCFKDELFQKVNELFELRPKLSTMNQDAREQEFELRLRAMESAMAKLDKEGVFGSGHHRERVVVAVEVMPPDHTNVDRVRRLNPSVSITEWLEEAAEE